MMKFLRWCLFVPAVIIFFWLIDLGLEWTISLVVSLKWGWILLITLIGLPTLIALMQFVGEILLMPLIFIAPDKPKAAKTIGVLCCVFLIGDCIGYAHLGCSVVGYIFAYLVLLLFWGGIVRVMIGNK